MSATPEQPPEELPAGTLVGEYRLDALIGSGGFARVYRAHHPVLKVNVAVKIITRALALDGEASARFVREAQAASRIAHPGVVRILGFGKLDDGRAYQVMELVDGPSLAGYLEDYTLSIDAALAMLDAIALALDAAHAAGIIHRDLKPANVLLALDSLTPRPRLADFGIAKALEGDETPHLTRTGATLGTPAYMSPEQALGRDVGPASDIYAFGVLAYELLTGRVPFSGDSAFETMVMHVQQEPARPSSVRPELGTRFDAALAAMLAKHPDERPATAARAMAALRAEPEVVSPPPRRRRVLLAGAGVLACAALLAAVFVGTLGGDEDGAPVQRLPATSVVPAPEPAPASRSTTDAVTPVASQPVPPPPVTNAAATLPPKPSRGSANEATDETPRTGAGSARPPRTLPAEARPAPRNPPAAPARAADTIELPPDYEP